MAQISEVRQSKIKWEATGTEAHIRFFKFLMADNSASLFLTNISQPPDAHDEWQLYQDPGGRLTLERKGNQIIGGDFYLGQRQMRLRRLRVGGAAAGWQITTKTGNFLLLPGEEDGGLRYELFIAEGAAPPGGDRPILRLLPKGDPGELRIVHLDQSSIPLLDLIAAFLVGMELLSSVPGNSD